MEKVPGYARRLAQVRVQQQQTKPFFGKAYIKQGQCFALCGYFFQLGGLLGARHSGNLDAFGPAFLGMQGEPGAIKAFFHEAAKLLMKQPINASMTFLDFISVEFMGASYAGDVASFYAEIGAKKINPETAAQRAWQFSKRGAVLGAVYPHVLRNMFEVTHAVVSKEEWDQAVAAGLNIPREQDLIGYEATEKAEDEAFMAYCQQCCPSLYAALTA
jgi:hypothetical protein